MYGNFDIFQHNDVYSVHVNEIRSTDLHTFMSVCTAVDCEILTDPNNGDVMLTTTTYLSIANYSCDTGYNLVGVDQRICTSAGTWSDGEPTCESESGYRMLLCNFTL